MADKEVPTVPMTYNLGLISVMIKIPHLFLSLDLVSVYMSRCEAENRSMINKATRQTWTEMM